MDGNKEEKVEVSSKKSNKTLYLVFAIVLLVVGGGAYWAGKSLNKPQVPQQVMESNSQRPAGPPSMKGQKFTDTNLFSQAVQIYPGPIDASAQKVMSGWNLKTKTLSDGTIQADLIPVGSEATEGDMGHSFNLKTGDKLYFADINPNDDGPTEDGNTHDDMGILVDGNEIVQ